MRVGECRRAQERLVRRDCLSAGPHSRNRIREHRPSRGHREPLDRLGTHRRAPTRNHEPTRARAHLFREPRDERPRRGPRGGERRGPRRAILAAGRVDEWIARGNERLPERQVEVHGTRRRTTRLGNGATRHRAPGRARTGPVRRWTGIVEPPHRAAEEVGLIDRLAGAGITQLRGPVGRAHDERYPGVVRLDDRGVEVGRRRPRRAQTHRGTPGCERDAERTKRGRAFVEDDVHAQPAVSGERERERRRPRPGRDDSVGDTGARPFVDQRGGERRRRVPEAPPGACRHGAAPDATMLR